MDPTAPVNTAPPPQPQNPPPQVVNTTKGGFSWSKVILTVVIILVVVGVIGGAYWYLVINKSASNVNTAPIKVSTPSAKTATTSATPSAKKDETEGWKTLISGKQGFSFKYPADSVVFNLDVKGNVGFATSQSLLKRQGGPPMGTIDRKTTGVTSGKEAFDAEINLNGDVKFKNVTINNATGVCVTEEDKYKQMLSDCYLGSTNGSRIVRIEVNTSMGDNPTEKEKKAEIEDFELYQKILSTFKFLPST